MGNSPFSFIKDLRPIDRTGEATRHLCAGMYLEREFRNTVIRRVHNDPYRSVAPSYGFDLVPVVHHAWRAWRFETAQDMIVLSLVVSACVLNPSVAVTAICCLGLWHFVRQLLRNGLVVLKFKARNASDRWLNREGGRREIASAEEHFRLLRSNAFRCVVLIALPPLSMGAQDASSHQVMWSTAALLVLIAGVVIGARMYRLRALEELRGAIPQFPPVLSDRQRHMQRQQDDLLVVFHRPEPKPETDGHPRASGEDETPKLFAGSGRLIHRWQPPMTIQLLKSGEGSIAEREHTEPPFKAHELVDRLKQVMKTIGHTADPVRLPGFRVNDRVYVSEIDAASGRDRAQIEAGRKDLSKIINDPHCAAHHYLEVSVSSSGELVTTVFLRVTVKGRSLSLDFAACALTRTPKDFQVYGTFPQGGPGALLRFVIHMLSDLPAEVGRLWRLYEGLPLMTGAVRTRKAGPAGHRPMCGTQPSIREEKSATWNDAKLDHPVIFDQMKIIEMRLLKATEDFLRIKNVDTSAFSKRAETIINASVLNMGQMDVVGSAIGDNAQVNQGAAHGAPEGAQA
ncbi:hypothetical protein [Actinomadura sp. HBU206391]|uniref:hypothetical protein n=1 Tax=Actinomadura sp. HBU206391 TaxID=2731692 RepID=UPI00164F7BBE|nr:hypothetical protein [Actinomadura sp. HBU206391]MBC6456593.1 hypothetical protein [Actinomadura sp. HBU206391]